MISNFIRCLITIWGVTVSSPANALSVDYFDAPTYARLADLIVLVKIEEVEKRGVSTWPRESDSFYLYTGVALETLKGPAVSPVRFISSRKISLDDSPTYLLVAMRKECREPETKDSSGECAGGPVFSTWPELETLNKVEARVFDGESRRVVLLDAKSEWLRLGSSSKLRHSQGSSDSFLLWEDAKALLNEWSTSVPVK